MSNRLSETRLTHHSFEIVDVKYLEKVFSSVRQKFSRPEGDEMRDVEVNGHRLREGQNNVRYLAEFDPESQT